MKRFLNWFFTHLYTDLAWAYDAIAAIVSVGQWNAWVATIIDPAPSGPTLELGHGPGHLMQELAGTTQFAVGADSSPQMARMAARRLRRSGLVVRLVLARAQSLPFKTRAFQAVLSTFPSDYIADPQSLAEVRRVLAHQGEFRMVPMAEINGPGLADQLAGALFRITKQSGTFPDAWIQQMQAAGFKAEREDIRLARSTVIRIRAVPV